MRDRRRAQNKLGEVLRTAREARDVDLARVERDTKIRARYLQALEDGDYAELPGAVYTKGFIRNYGAYLGLDTEYLVDLYRLESSQPTTEKPTVPTPPRPISTRRSRPLVVTPGVIMAALLTVAVAIVIYWIGAELRDVRAHTAAGHHRAGEATFPATTSSSTRSSAPPSQTRGSPWTGCARTRPSPPMRTATSDRGRPRARIERDHPGGQRPADGSRQRGGHTHHRGRRYGRIAVGGPGGGGLHRPGGGSHGVGPVRVTGTAPPDSQVTLGATLVEQAAPTIRIESLAGDEVPVPNRRPPAPDPVRLTANAQGAFSGTLALAPGTWDLTLTR